MQTCAGRMAMVGDKPPYKKRVQWLATRAYTEPWIDTGLPIINSTGYQVEMEFRYDSFLTANESWVLGSWSGGDNWRIFLIGFYSKNLRAGAGPDSSPYYGEIPRDTNFHNVKILNDGVYWDGIWKAGTQLTDMPDFSGRNVPLFKSYHSNDPRLVRAIKFCKMWSISGELLRDFQAVVDFADVPCMHDAVTNENFYSANSTSFIAGPDL